MRWLSSVFGGPAPVPLAIPGVPLTALSTHLCLFGRTGSGKSILLGQVAEAVLRSGAGCFWPADKVTSRAQMEAALARTGRADDAVWIARGSGVTVNPLAGVLPGFDPGTQAVEIARLTLEILRAMVGVPPGGDARDGGFWSLGQEAVLLNACGLLLTGLPECEPSFELLHEVIATAPQSPDDLDEPAYRRGLNARLCGRAAANGGERYATYWTRTFVSIAEKTRSGFTALPLNGLDLLSQGLTGAHLNGRPDRRPLDLAAAIERGQCVLVDYPPLAYEQAPALLCALKRALFAPLLSRRVTPETRRFVMLFDEAPQYVAPTDAKLLETVRGSKASVVLVTQGRESMVGKFGGGPGGDAQADAILGNCGVHVHCRPMPETAQWLCRTLGQELGVTVSGNTGGAEPQGFAEYLQGSPRSMSAGYGQQMLNLFNPSDFSRMRCGSDSPFDRKTVDYLLTPGGGGRPFRKCSFTRS